MPRNLVLIGATATGKTELALEVARKIKGEIISADSRQVYKFLSAGLAKPEGKWVKKKGGDFYEVERISYHLVDFLEPNLTFDAVSFAGQAEKIVSQIEHRNHIPVFVGGTGLYLQAFFIGFDKLPPANETIRQKLTAEVAKKGNELLHEKLKKIDPVSAIKIPAGNTQRLIRAMEVYRLTGKSISSFHTKKTNELPVNKALFVLLNWDKKLLHKRIETRTHNMLDDMVTETKKLPAKGYKSNCAALESLGYREILQYINGSLTKTQTLEKIIQLTKAYAKRQVTWFKRYKNVFTINITAPAQWQPEKLTDQIIKEWKK